MSVGTSDSILEDLFRSLPKEPGGDRPEEKHQSKKKLRNASENENSDRSPSSERVKKSSKKSKKKKKRESSDRDLDLGSSRHKKKKRHGSSDSELSDSLRDTRSKKKKKRKSKLRDDIYDTRKTHVEIKKDRGTVYAEKGEVSKKDHKTELAKIDQGKLEQTIETLNIPHFKRIVSPIKPTESQSKLSTLTITVPSNKNQAIRHVGYTSVANPSLDIPLPSSGIVLDVIPLPEDAKTHNASVKNSHETENFRSEPKKDGLDIGKICEDVRTITDDNNLTIKEIEYSGDESKTNSKEQEKKVASETETRPANSDIHKPAVSGEEDRMMKLISQVIEEVDAKEKEREKYEDGEITSEELEKEDDEVPKKKKKQKRDKEKNPREGDKSEKNRRDSRSPSVRKRRSRSTSSYAKSARASEKRTRHSPSSGARKADRSPSHRRSRSPRGSVGRSGHSRYSEQGRRRSRSPTHRHSLRRSPSRHGDKRRRSPERDRRRRKSPVRPFRVGGPRDYRSRSRSRSRRRSRSSSPRFDKARLLKIARQNLEKMKFAGILPENVTQGDVWKTIQAGGRTVKDLTDFCTRLAEKDDLSGSDVSDKEEFRHPFQLKPAPAEKGIGAFQFNIKNAITLPVRSSGEIIQSASKLKEQFPVSSGTTHRKSDNEWVPVEKTEEPKEKYHPALTVSDAGHRMVKNQLGQKHEPKERETNVVAPMPREKVPERPVVSISELVAKRIAAMRRFQDNPKDADAKRQLEEIEEKTRDWVSRKEKEYETNRPPSFIDFSTAPQSWASTAQFANAAPVSSGPGLRLLQKMGWQHGEGLGRNKDGNLEPLQLDIKMDKKGLVSREEQQPIRTPISNAARTVAGKHPVSLLMEACGRRRWPPPHFEQTLAAGPDHMKQFLFKVTVNNIDYRPVMASSTKKEAKAQCAAVCLQALGLLPKETA